MRIDIYLDTVCPWCRIGKQHLFQALESFSGDDVELTWHAFLLDQTVPREGKPMAEFMSKFGSPERVQQMHAYVCEAGAACGVNFHFEEIQKIPNTRLSHQLIQVTERPKQTRLVEEIMKAYFEEGLDIGDLNVLCNVAEKAGISAIEAREKIARQEGLDAIRCDLEFAHRVGITGVPFFIFNNKYALSGAQPVNVFVEALKQATQQ